MNVKNIMNWILTGNKEGNFTAPCYLCGKQTLPKEAKHIMQGLLCQDCVREQERDRMCEFSHEDDWVGRDDRETE